MKAAEAAIYDRLSNDATLATLTGNTGGDAPVYKSPAPNGANEPFIVWQKQSGVPTYVMGREIWRDLIYQIKAVDRGDDDTAAKDIDERINAVLSLQSLTIDGQEAMIVRREADVDYVEVEDGVQYQHVGGNYRIEVES